MAIPRPGPATYRAVTLAALVLLCIITLTGAAVRLTGSGLGCDDWPRCDDSGFVQASNAHQAIEQINRLFTGIVAVVVVLAVLGSLVRRPRRRDLVLLSLGLVAGIIAQVVIGGIVVLTDVHPAAVQLHFLCSMGMIWNALVLHHRAGRPDGADARAVVGRGTARWSRALVVAAGLALVTGTVVTGTGPHGGDEDARRFDFAITTVARVHGLTVIATLGLALWLVRVAKRAGDWARLEDPVSLFLYALVFQGFVGYTQYLTGVPVVLVAVHICGAMAVWITALRVDLGCRASAQAVTDAAANAPSRAAVA